MEILFGLLLYCLLLFQFFGDLFGEFLSFLKGDHHCTPPLSSSNDLLWVYLIKEGEFFISVTHVFENMEFISNSMYQYLSVF